MIFSWILSTLGTIIFLATLAHHLPLVQKPNLFAYEHLPSSQEKWGLGLASLSVLKLVMNSPIGHNYISFCVMICFITMRASLHPTSSNSFFSSSTWAVSPWIDNLHKISTTTLALHGWYIILMS